MPTMLRVKQHINFLKNLLKKEETFEFFQMAHLKTSAIYWSLTASILLSSLDEIYPSTARQEIIDFLGRAYKDDGGFAGNEGAHDSHLLFTLSAIQIMLLILGRGHYPYWFNRELTINYIVRLQNHQGAFMGDLFGDVDSRFTYCAVASLSLLNSLEKALPEPAKSKTISFLNSCRNFDGGFGAVFGSESHGGNIFCCVSALAILGQDPADANENLVEWLVWRQLPQGGFNGRPEKLPDVCYSWWILSSLATNNHLNHINSAKLQEFILQCQDIQTEMGGFADRPGDVGDVFHTLFGLTGLALLKYPDLKEEVDPLYCLPAKYL